MQIPNEFQNQVPFWLEQGVYVLHGGIMRPLNALLQLPDVHAEDVAAAVVFHRYKDAQSFWDAVLDEVIRRQKACAERTERIERSELSDFEEFLRMGKEIAADGDDPQLSITWETQEGVRKERVMQLSEALEKLQAARAA